MSITKKIKQTFVFTAKNNSLNWLIFSILNLFIIFYGVVNTVPDDFFQTTTLYIGFLTIYAYISPFFFILFLVKLLHPFQRKGVITTLCFLSSSKQIQPILIPIFFSVIGISFSFILGSFLTFYNIGTLIQVMFIASTFPITIIYVTGLTLFLFTITNNTLYTSIFLATLFIVDYAATGMFYYLSIGLNGMIGYGDPGSLNKLIFNRGLLLILGISLIWLSTHKRFLTYWKK